MTQMTRLCTYAYKEPANEYCINKQETKQKKKYKEDSKEKMIVQIYKSVLWN
jgi:hypothetical protein